MLRRVTLEVATNDGPGPEWNWAVLRGGASLDEGQAGTMRQAFADATDSLLAMVESGEMEY